VISQAHHCLTERRRALHDSDTYPFVSIILPVRNEADFIERCLRSVCDQDYPVDRMEILVVDGMSTDGTREIVSRMASVDPRIRLLDNPRKAVATAMNIGVGVAQGDLFTRIDGHALVDPRFLRQSVQSLKDHPEAWVAGGPIETVGEGRLGEAIAAAMSSSVGVGNSRFRTGGYEGWVDTLAFGTHHRWVVKRVGIFDEELVRNQDDDFNQRIRQAGGKIRLSSAIRSRYYSRSSLTKLWRQYFQYGFWRIRTLQKHRRIGALRQLVPMAFVSGILLLGLLSLVWPPAGWLLGAGLAAYALVILLGAFFAARTARWSCLPAIVASFVILHFSYGLGSLWGLIRFGLLRGAGMPHPGEHRLSR
jgi:succinoglycan biosynthesis protein ExoA